MNLDLFRRVIAIICRGFTVVKFSSSHMPIEYKLSAEYATMAHCTSEIFFGEQDDGDGTSFMSKSTSSACGWFIIVPYRFTIGFSIFR